MGASVTRNILFNFISQLYVSIVGIIFIPLLVKGLGPEAFGLVAFYSSLVTIFYLLDLGLTPTIGRETARLFSGREDVKKFFNLYKTLKIIFFVMGLFGVSVIVILSDKVALSWLSFQKLQHSEVIFAIKIMGVIVATRWMGGFYRGIINGSEKQGWQSILNIIIATFRSIVVLPFLGFFGYTITNFFIYQLIVSVLELLLLIKKSKNVLDIFQFTETSKILNFLDVFKLLRFSLSIAFTTCVWILITQLDKFALSGLLPLKEYGYFSLGVLVASGVLLLSGPISTAIMPRMAFLFSQGQIEEMNVLYRKSTQIVAILSGCASLVIWFVAHPLLYLWTGNIEIANHTFWILKLYAAGNGLLTLASFPYYYQYAQGNLKYHFIGSFLLAICMIPCLVIFTAKWGGVGAGCAWLVLNIIYILTWVTYSHKKLGIVFYLEWLKIDLIRILLPVFFWLMFLSHIMAIESLNKLVIFSMILFYTFSSLVLALLFSTFFNNVALCYFKKCVKLLNAIKFS